VAAAKEKYDMSAPPSHKPPADNPAGDDHARTAIDRDGRQEDRIYSEMPRLQELGGRTSRAPRAGRDLAISERADPTGDELVGFEHRPLGLRDLRRRCDAEHVRERAALTTIL
jgi:hypothetical protein